MKPLVSVIMSVYNGEKYLDEAIKSIIKQTYNNIEFIIIDDGSTDRSVEIINSYDDNRIRLYKNEANLGLAKSLNRAIELSTGKYIARMDSDDISYSDRLENQVNYLEKNPDIVICGGNAKILENGELKGEIRVPSDDANIRFGMLFANKFIHPTVVLRREFLIKNNLKYGNNYVDDYDLWLRIMKIGKMANFHGYVLNYRIHSTNFSIVNKKTHVDIETLKLRRKYIIEDTCFNDNEQVVLNEVFDSKTIRPNMLNVYYEAILKYSKYTSNRSDDEYVVKLITKDIYDLCWQSVHYGVSVFVNYMKIDKKYRDISLKKYLYLLLKCITKGKLHRI